jgi:ribonuclease VapC
MIVDTSALIAIIRGEPDGEQYARALTASPAPPLMSAATYLEAAIVVDMGGGPVASRLFDRLLDDAGIRVEPVTALQAVIARRAYRDFGKGSRHPAQLNYGDCFSYALATDRQEPLLFKGSDFSHTDIRDALS